MRPAIMRELRHHFGCRRHESLTVALAGYFEPPAFTPGRIASAEKLPHRVDADLGDAQAAQIQQREEPSHTAVTKALPRRLARHRFNVGLDLLPQLRLEVSGDPRRRLACPLTRQG